MFVVIAFLYVYSWNPYRSYDIEIVIARFIPWIISLLAQAVKRKPMQKAGSYG